MSCYACRFDSEAVVLAHPPSKAFLAGIAFVATFNDAAMRARLCDAHFETLQRAHAGALSAVKLEDRRVVLRPRNDEVHYALDSEELDAEEEGDHLP